MRVTVSVNLLLGGTLQYTVHMCSVKENNDKYTHRMEKSLTLL